MVYNLLVVIEPGGWVKGIARHNLVEGLNANLIEEASGASPHPLLQRIISESPYNP